MPTIEEFAGQAALKGKPLSFETDGIHYRLVRIDDRLYYRAHEQGASIQDDHGFYLQLWGETERSGSGLGLAETYAALTMLLGESSESYDDWKCSFSFPCLLEVQRGIRRLRLCAAHRGHQGRCELPAVQTTRERRPAV